MRQICFIDGKRYTVGVKKKKFKKPYVYASLGYRIDDIRHGEFTFVLRYVSPRLIHRIEKGDDIRIALNFKYMSTNTSGVNISRTYYRRNNGLVEYGRGYHRRRRSKSYYKRKGNKYKCYHVSVASFWGYRRDPVAFISDPLKLKSDHLTTGTTLNHMFSMHTGYGNKLASVKGCTYVDESGENVYINLDKLMKYLIFEPVLVECPSGRVLKTYSEEIKQE